MPEPVAPQPMHEEVAPGIHRLAVPVPFAGLAIVNCYLLRDAKGRGWTAVDSGLNTEKARDIWERALAELGWSFSDLKQIVVTHSHPDHFGLTGWLQSRAGGKPAVWISKREWEIVHIVWKDRSPHRDAELLRHAERCGVPPEVMRQLYQTRGVDQENASKAGTRPFPAHVQHLEHGDTMNMGGRAWQAVHTPGHSDGHLAFYDRDAKVMLTGDQILPHITPNIGLWPGVEPDPLGRYLRSLPDLKNFDVSLALPGHGPLIRDWLGRIGELEQHHAERLQHMMVVVRELGTATVWQVAERSFDFLTLTPAEWPFALVETLSHLDYLVTRESMQRSENSAGVWVYRLPNF